MQTLNEITHPPVTYFSVLRKSPAQKRFSNKILDYSQLLSSTLNITQEGCEKLQRVQAQGSVNSSKRRPRINAAPIQNEAKKKKLGTT